MEDLEKVIKDDLKSKISRDPDDNSNELIKQGGQDLQIAILTIMNKIKNQQIYPEVMEKVNISSIYKNKGKRNNLEFYRGVFRVPFLRNILDRLMYNDEYKTIDENLTDSNVGARKERNIRDNIFVLNAITNSVKNGNEAPIEVNVYDAIKCFDNLWLQECINRMYIKGFRNDRLPLLYLSNKSAQIAVKTSSGMTERETISNIVMQGTVWSSLKCTVTMDKLGEMSYENPYKYKGKVDIPMMGMVDDVISVEKCSNKAVISNSTINTFMELNKLELSESKCSKIHIGKKNENCPKLKVHNTEMKKSTQEKYLGDIIDESGGIEATIKNRVQKAWGYHSQIKAMLNELPLGNRRVQAGLKLREAMLINGVLFNSEAWHGVTATHVARLQIVDNAVLREIVSGHSKVPTEFLHLEMGALPISNVITSRRLNYLKHILDRADEELIKRVYLEQRENPTKGDWIELIKTDIEKIELKLTEDEMKLMTKNEFRKYIKSLVYKMALIELKKKQEKHSKIKFIEYENLTMQKYMCNPKLTFKQISTLFALRSRTVKRIKCNFKTHYKDNVLCHLCNKHDDTQEHCIECDVIKTHNPEMKEHIKYNHIFGDKEQQVQAAQYLHHLLTIRTDLLEEDPALEAGP